MSKFILEPLDPTSDLYRICKNDQKPFMASHRNQVHCNEKCADDYNNRKKRNEAQSVKKSDDITHIEKHIYPIENEISNKEKIIETANKNTQPLEKQVIPTDSEISVQEITEEINTNINNNVIHESLEEKNKRINEDKKIEKLKNNIKILESLGIEDELTIIIDYLYSLGYDFSIYSGKGQLYNIDKSFNCHFIQIGVFRLVRAEFSHILIKIIT